MPEIPAPDTGDLRALRGEVRLLRKQNSELERGLRSVARVVEALVGPLEVPVPSDELAARRARRGAAFSRASSGAHPAR